MKIYAAEQAAERLEVYRFRYRIYISELQKAIPDVDHVEQALYDRWDETATILYAQNDRGIIGTVRVMWGVSGIPEHYRAWYGLNAFSVPQRNMSFTGRMMVAREMRKTSLPLHFAAAVLKLVNDREIVYDFIHTSVGLVTFCRRLGYQTYKEDIVDPALGLRTPMFYNVPSPPPAIVRAYTAGGAANSPTPSESFSTKVSSRRDVVCG